MPSFKADDPENPFLDTFAVGQPRTPSRQHGSALDFGSPMDTASDSPPTRFEAFNQFSPMDEGSNLGFSDSEDEDEDEDEDENRPILMSLEDQVFVHDPSPKAYPDPRQPPPTHGTTTVYELLTAVLHRGSPYYLEQSDGKVVMASTATPKPKRLGDKEVLRCVVYAPEMFDDVLAEARKVLSTPAMTIDWANTAHRDWASGILPYYTGRRRVKKVHSEKDIELAVFTMIIQPALNVALAVMAGEIPTDLHGPPGSPYLSSSVASTKKGAIVPDLLMIWGPGLHPQEDIKMRGEMKSRNVIQERPRRVKPVDQSEATADVVEAAGQASDSDSSASKPSDEPNEGTDESGDDEGRREGESAEEDVGTDDEEVGSENEVDEEDEDVDAEDDDGEDVDVEDGERVDANEEGAGDDDDENEATDAYDEDGAPRHIFGPLQELTETFLLGYAARFKWPTTEGTWSKLTKVIMQVSGRLRSSKRFIGLTVNSVVATIASGQDSS